MIAEALGEDRRLIEESLRAALQGRVEAPIQGEAADEERQLL